MALGPPVLRKQSIAGNPNDPNCNAGARTVDVWLNVPVTRPFVGVGSGGGKLFYFGGGHSGFSANTAETFDVQTGRWTESSYVPDVGCQMLAGRAISPATPTASGRPWWEHNMNRLAWDARVGQFMNVQNSGTWFYNTTSEVWTQAVPFPPPPAVYGYPGGSSEEWKCGTLRFDPRLNAMVFWGCYGAIWRLDYGSGPPAFTGARWVLMHAVPNFSLETFTSAHTYDTTRRRHYYLRIKTTPTSEVITTPKMWWFDPLAGSSCLSNPRPCGLSGVVDMTGGPNATSTCPNDVCEIVFGSMAYDPSNDELYVVTRDGSPERQILLWGLKNGGAAGQQWRKITGLSGDIPKLPVVGEGSLVAHSVDLLHYDTVKNVLLLTLRSGGGSSDGRGGVPDGAPPCQNDACFRMWALRIQGAAPPR